MSSRRQFLRLDRIFDATGPLTFSRACIATQQVACRICVEACPESALRLMPGRPAQPRLEAGRCTRCGDCAAVCPTQAITLTAAPERCAA